jgi:hypothetical protein
MGFFPVASQHYRCLVQIIDYRQIVPLVKKWSDQLFWLCDSSHDVLFLHMASLGKCADLAQGRLLQLLLQLLVPMILTWYRELTTMVTMDLVEPRYSMSFKLMEFATCSHVHCSIMMLVCFTPIQYAYYAISSACQ